MIFEIKEICQVDKFLSDNLLSLIAKDHWKINTIRQRTYRVHRFTETIRLRHVKDLNFNDSKFLNYEAYDHYKLIIDQYLEIISKYFTIKDYTALIVNLKPKGIIDSHRDLGSEYFKIGHRLHIPIKTNKDVLFTVGNTKVNMEVGKIYEIDNTEIHSVENNSGENRIHLIMDIFDREYKSNA